MLNLCFVMSGFTKKIFLLKYNFNDKKYQLLSIFLTSS